MKGDNSVDRLTAESVTNGVQVAWQHSISTRLILLLLGVIVVLVAASIFLLWRGFGGLVAGGFDLNLTGGGTAEQPTAVDPELVGAVLRSTLINLTAVVAVTVVAAAAFSRTLLAEPIGRLTAATRALASGDTAARLDLTDRSELGELARSFDGMADALLAAQSRLESRVSARTAELRGLLDLSNKIAVGDELKPQLEAVLARLVESIPGLATEVLELAPSGRLTALAAVGEVPQLAAPDQPADDHPAREIAPNAVVDDAALALPLRARDHVVGVLHAYLPAGETWDEERLRLASGLAAQAAVAIENARLYERAREQAADEERQHLARELHDSVSQAIYAVVLTSHAAKKRVQTDPAGSEAALGNVIELAEAALAEMRALIFELRPEALAEVGLVGALNRQLDGLELRHAIATDRQLGPEPELPFETKQVLLRVAQEALHNVAKHAHAKLVTVSSGVAADRLTIEVGDDGVGFDPSRSYPGHLGLTSMHERVGALGGRLRVESVPGTGTTVRIEVPLQGGSL